TMLENVSESHSSTAATIFGIVMLVFGATGVFVQLKDALNTIWRVRQKPKGIKGFFETRLVSFTVILGVGFLLLVSLILSTALTALAGYIDNLLPHFSLIIKLMNLVFTLFVITIVFSFIFKYLPDVDITWKDVWVGAAVTAVLFTVGKYLIGLYLGNSNITSTFGAARSLVIILMWTFYSSLLLIFGAEFTKIYANHYGTKIRPADDAIKYEIEEVELDERDERKDKE
ncbi:MAG: YihY/virulence factor BrkB family protein, partial [Calditrichia bacterium]